MWVINCDNNGSFIADDDNQIEKLQKELDFENPFEDYLNGQGNLELDEDMFGDAVEILEIDGDDLE